MVQEFDIGIIGLGVMGRNLALNLADHRYRVALFDPWPEARTDLVAMEDFGRPEFCLADDLATFVTALKPPRVAILLIKSGLPVSELIAELKLLLEAGDIIIDAGNSHYPDSLGLARELGGTGTKFLDVGLSGGGEGARLGPCLMAGGSHEAYGTVKPIFEAIAARAAGVPCTALLGGNGAGHFVKMIHNGIEYAVMQIIGEIYLLMRDGLGLDALKIGDSFAEWGSSGLGSYLLEITVDVLRRVEPDSGRPLVEMVLDSAEQKGTGRWAAIEALTLGVPAPCLSEAVAARTISAAREDRLQATSQLSGPPPKVPERPSPELVSNLKDAYQAATISAYAQGFAVLSAAEAHHGWTFDLQRIAALWCGGSILRARLLETVAEAYGAQDKLGNLLLSPRISEIMSHCQDGWRTSLAFGLDRGLPLPVLGAGLAYYDAYRNTRLWSSLTQLQRDRFGAHGFKRQDRPGTHHLDGPAKD